MKHPDSFLDPKLIWRKHYSEKVGSLDRNQGVPLTINVIKQRQAGKTATRYIGQMVKMSRCQRVRNGFDSRMYRNQAQYRLRAGSKESEYATRNFERRDLRGSSTERNLNNAGGNGDLIGKQGVGDFEL